MTWIRMADESEEYLLGPVEAGMCRYESLLDGTVGMEDLARMNEFLMVKAENEKRFRKANEK